MMTCAPRAQLTHVHRSMLTTAPPHLHQQAVLRVHQLSLRAGDAKQGGVKLVSTIQEAGVAHAQLRFAVLRMRYGWMDEASGRHARDVARAASKKVAGACCAVTSAAVQMPPLLLCSEGAYSPAGPPGPSARMAPG